MPHGNLGYILGCVLGAALMVLMSIPWPDPGPHAHWRFRYGYPYLPLYLLVFPLAGLCLAIGDLKGAWFFMVLLGAPWFLFARYKMRRWTRLSSATSPSHP